MMLRSRWVAALAMAVLSLALVAEVHAAAPTISTLTPPSAAVGASITIAGTNFGSSQGSSTVKFNGTTASVTSWAASSIVATVPSGATTGNVVVTVSNKASNGVSFTVLPTPTLSNVAPTSGAVGATVTVTGTNLGSTQGSGTVKFNGTGATVTTWSATSIVVTVPSGATTGNVVVHTSGVDTNGASFTVLGTPAISTLSLTTGAPGASVTLTGTNFGTTQGSGTVTFNGTTASITGWSATSIVTTVPSAATSGNVVVHTSGVNSNGLSFTVVPAPTITGISPVSGMLGASVTISGTNFGSSQGTSTVTLNSLTCSVANWSATSITVAVPAGATSGPFAVTVAGVTVNSQTFTVSALPPGWLNQDIGAPNPAGSGSYSNGVFTVGGSGGFGGGSTADSFNFAYKTLTGDGTIVARVASVSNAYAQAGVMMRETLNTNSTTIFMSSLNSLLYYRTTTGGAMTYAYGSSTIPYWYKVTRSGSLFTGFVSRDGVNWVKVGTSQTINMAQTIYVGLGIASGSPGNLFTATFDNVSVNSTSSPAPVITSVSTTTAAVGAQVVITGQNFGATQGSSAVLLHGAATTVNAWSATSITITIPTGATSGYLVVSVAPSMNNSNPIDFTVETNPLPQNWLDQDVGAVGVVGNASYSNGVFAVYGGGTSNSDNMDGFHFVYQPLTGDGTIVARVVSESGISNLHAGVMMSASLTGWDQNIFACVCGTNSFAFYRSFFGAWETNLVSAGGLPYWVKIVRTGNNFIAYKSPDNVSWTLIAGPVPLSMPSTIYVGVAVSSDQPNLAYTGNFDNVSVTTTSNPAPVITSLSATTGSVGTQVILSGSGFGSSQGSSIATLNEVPLTVNLWSNTSVMVTIPTGATSGYLNVLRAPDMNSSNGVYFAVTTQPLISGWYDQDIGNVAARGSATYSGGVFTIQGAGPIGSSADALHFVYQPLSTDGTIIARIASANSSSRQGVMIRMSLDASSTDAFTYMYPYGNPPVVAGFDYRNLKGAPTHTTTIGASSVGWVKLTRNTNTFAAYVSTDGGSWTQVGTTQTIPCPQTVYIGLAVTGNSSLWTATFDNVAIVPGSSLANPVVTGLSPSTGAPGTLVTISGSGFGATQSSSSVNFNGAPAASIYSWSDTQIQAVVPDQATTGPITVTVGNITGQGPNFTIAFTATLTDSLGNSTSYKSSLFGGQWAFTDAQGSGCSSCTTRGTVHNQYDGQGDLAWTVDAMGHGTVYVYDSSNNLTSQSVQGDGNTQTATTTYDYTVNSCTGFGQPCKVTDPLSHVTTNTYDAHGNLKTVTTPAPNGSTAASVTQFGYNTLGELTTITDPLNHVTTLTYTAAGLIQTITDVQNNVTTYGYDSHGNRTSVTDALNHQTTFAYDAMDRLKTITYPDTTTTQFGYDYRGRRTTVTDQNGKVTTYAYDDGDRLTSVTDAATPANVTTYAYDTENNLTSITDANNNQTTFAYDAYGRVTQTNFPSTQIETYQYDANNNLTSKTDRKNQAIQYVYDVLNRLTRKIYPDSTEVDYVYDLVGKIQQVNDPTGTYAFAYDNMGRLIGTTTNYTFLTGKTFSNSYSYDAASNRAGFTDPETGSTTYAYDTLNRLQTLTPPAAFTAGSFGFSYDALSRRTQMTRPNTVATNYGYDNLSHLTSVLHQLSGSTIDGATYTVDNAGNRTAKTDQRVAVTANYGYDNIYQLLSATQGANTTESYTYDPVGNRLSSLGVASYTNNTSNELTATSLATYGYDLNGNATTKNDSTGITTYGWDYENRLTSVTLPASGGTVSFAYDPFGRRIKKVSASATSVFAYDGDNLIEETSASGAVVTRYSQGLNIDEPLAMLRSGATSFYNADGLGSVTSLANTSGSLAQTYTFDSFGKLTASSGSLTNPFQYTGRESDSETGLYYYRARYYDAATGRFLSEDSMRFVAGIDFYPYTLNSPVNLRDPSGKNAGAIAIPVAGTICFGSGICETIIVVGGAVVTVALVAEAVSVYLKGRTRAKSDPIPWPGVKDPGRCDDDEGKCKPCPPDTPFWEQQGQPGAHGSSTGVHYHWWHWNQTPYPECKCYPARMDGANPPPGGTPYTPGGQVWP